MFRKLFERKSPKSRRTANDSLSDSSNTSQFESETESQSEGELDYISEAESTVLTQQQQIQDLHGVGRTTCMPICGTVNVLDSIVIG